MDSAVRGTADVAIAIVSFTLLAAWRASALLVVAWCVVASVLAAALLHNDLGRRAHFIDLGQTITTSCPRMEGQWHAYSNRGRNEKGRSIVRTSHRVLACWPGLGRRCRYH